MAAPRSGLQEADSDSSAEDLERFREAAWEPPGPVRKTVQHPENSAVVVVPSLRGRPESHEDDGNELQTTPEFRAHVAKKLSAMLDSCIKEIPGNSRFNRFTATSDSEDEGFRLLTTSVPGDSGIMLPSPTLKRRVASSTSEDSEEEKQRRCSEAAVSGFDILRNSALQTVPVEIMDASNNNQAKKKKKKKAKKNRGLTDEAGDLGMEPRCEINMKKKKRESRTSDETQSEGKEIASPSEVQSKKNKSGSDHNTAEAVMDGSKKKKKKMGLNKETASEQKVNPLCGKSGSKNKKRDGGCGTL